MHSPVADQMSMNGSNGSKMQIRPDRICTRPDHKYFFQQQIQDIHKLKKGSNICLWDNLDRS